MLRPSGGHIDGHVASSVVPRVRDLFHKLHTGVYGQTEAITPRPTPAHHHFDGTHHSCDIRFARNFCPLSANAAHAPLTSGPVQTPRARRTPTQAPSTRRARRRPETHRVSPRRVVIIK